MDRPAPALSAGLALKPAHFDAARQAGAAGLWFEVHAENYMVDGGPRRGWLQAVRERHPVALHGVALSLAGTDPIDRAHLARLADLVRAIEPALVSEHLAFSHVAGRHLPDLLPCLRTHAALKRIAARIAQVQDALGRTIAIENPSHYLHLPGHDWDEVGFLTELAQRTGCTLLLDINNVFVSSRNLGCDAGDWIDRFPPSLVSEIHLAGHTEDPRLGPALLVDSHDAPVDDAVWRLCERFLRRAGARPVLIERDGHIPPFADLMDERERAAELLARVAAGPKVARTLKDAGTAAAGGEGPWHAARPCGDDRAMAMPASRVRVVAAAGHVPSGFEVAEAADAIDIADAGHRADTTDTTDTTDTIDAAEASEAAFQRRFVDALGMAGDHAAELLPGVASQAAFAVYRNTVVKACIDALAANHPTVERLVGSEWFGAAALRHVAGHLPRDGRLLVYDAGFADFVQSQADALGDAADLPYLGAVARLDQAWRQAHAAADAPALDPAALARLVPDALAALVLRPHPAARWFWHEQVPAFAIWRQHRDGAADGQPIRWEGDGGLITRPADEVCWQAITHAQHTFLDACGRGLPLGLAAEHTLERHPDADFAAVLPALLQSGCFLTLDHP